MKMNSPVRRERAPLSTFSKIMLVLIGIFSVVMAVLGIMARCGLTLIDTAIYLVLLAALVLSFAVWGVGILLRHIRKRAYRIAAGVGAATLAVLLIMLASIYATYFLTYIPSRYSSPVAQDGTELVVFRGYYFDQARINARYPTEDGTDAQPTSLDDYSYVYLVYPKALGIFYRANADVEGQVFIGVDSEAKLMIDYPGDKEAKLYIESAEEFDTGECTLKWE